MTSPNSHSSLQAHAVRAIEYDARCTPLTIASLTRAQEQVRKASIAALAPPMERALEVFAHIQAARRVWLSRVSTLTTFPSEGVFPVWPLDRSVQEAKAMDELWVKFVAGLDDAALGRDVRYTSTEGPAYVSTLSDILMHVVSHSCYHRGQIASLVAMTGTKPEVTDYIALTRTRV